MPKKSETEEEKPKKKEFKKLSNSEYEKEVIDLANKGLTADKIGEQLRQKGVHSKEYKRKISKILKEKNLYANIDLKNVEKKLESITEHSEKNKQDKRAMREKVRIYAKLRKLKKYFKVE
tara:strand:+ start:4121 stop:4480 length:360 start_codon:yes stop_codon:yes gene_type:complete